MEDALQPPSSRVVGSWELARWTQDGSPCTRFGPRPRGYLTYTSARQMSVTLLSGDRLPLPAEPESGEVAVARVLRSPASWRGWLAIYVRQMSYCGRYDLQGEHEVVHYVEAATVPQWVGSVQRRALAFDAGELVLTNRLGRSLHRLHWRKIADHALGS